MCHNHHDDWDEGEVHEPVTNPQAIVSVSFAPDDLQIVASQARQHRQTIASFIHDLILRQVYPSTGVTMKNASSVDAPETTGKPATRVTFDTESVLATW